MAPGSWIQTSCEARLYTYSLSLVVKARRFLCADGSSPMRLVHERDACSSGDSSSVIAGRGGCSGAGRDSLLSASAM